MREGVSSSCKERQGKRKARDRMRARIDSGSRKSDRWRSSERGEGAVSVIVVIAGLINLEEAATVVGNGQRC